MHHDHQKVVCIGMGIKITTAISIHEVEAGAPRHRNWQWQLIMTAGSRAVATRTGTDPRGCLESKATENSASGEGRKGSMRRRRHRHHITRRGATTPNPSSPAQGSCEQKRAAVAKSCLSQSHMSREAASGQLSRLTFFHCGL